MSDLKAAWLGSMMVTHFASTVNTTSFLCVMSHTLVPKAPPFLNLIKSKAPWPFPATSHATVASSGATGKGGKGTRADSLLPDPRDLRHLRHREVIKELSSHRRFYAPQLFL